MSDLAKLHTRLQSARNDSDETADDLRKHRGLFISALEDAYENGSLITTEQADARAGALLAEAIDVIADYPRASPGYDEWTRYDEQIAHSQEILRNIAPDAQAALARAIAKAREDGHNAAIKAAAKIANKIVVSRVYRHSEMAIAREIEADILALVQREEVKG